MSLLLIAFSVSFCVALLPLPVKLSLSISVVSGQVFVARLVVDRKVARLLPLYRTLACSSKVRWMLMISIFVRCCDHAAVQ